MTIMYEKENKREFTEARFNLLPNKYVTCTINYQKADEHGDTDYVKPSLILKSFGYGKDRRWKIIGEHEIYNNKELVKLIHRAIDSWNTLSPDNSIVVTFKDETTGDEMYIFDIFRTGTILDERFDNWNTEHYKGFKTVVPQRKKVTQKKRTSCVKVNVRKMF